MPDAVTAWGIDIGQAGLKALRLQYSEATRQVLAVAFDYVPHSKFLSLPDANADELIATALDTFLSRNVVKGDRVAISVPGQMALAKFIQLPPVDKSKIAEIVKYEARQQIPFALEDVVWDYQPMGGSGDESGFMLDAEVGLFAMKKDQVAQQLNPYLKRKVEVELIQIAPIALYGYVCHDQLGQAPGSESAEDEDYSLVLDMGADNTMLVVTNGRKIWIRNVPVGGNHFTRALTKEMKLTFAKAEHLKCNATKSQDPKAIFQALRPVFNDYAGEIQRSIGYFSSVNRSAKIKRIIGLGNGFQLAGLQKFLQQNLQIQVDRVDHFPGLVGDTVLNSPLFQENLLSFGVPYGLALQAIGLTRIKTSLLPPEIRMQRMIRRKKPLAVAAAATLLVGLATSTMGFANNWRSVSKDYFATAETEQDQAVKKRDTLKSAYEAEKSKNAELQKSGGQLIGSQTGKLSWMEVYRAINESLPRDLTIADADQTDPSQKNQIRIMEITSTKYADLGVWFKALDQNAVKQYMSTEEAAAAPTGVGYVFKIRGRHFHHDPKDTTRSGVQYVINTLLKNLKSWEVRDGLPISPDAPPGQGFPVRKLGISHALLTYTPTAGALEVKYTKEREVVGSGGMLPPGIVPPIGVPGSTTGSGFPPGFNPANYGPPGGRPVARPPATKTGKAGPKANPAARKTDSPDDAKVLKQTDFILEFAWKETPEDKRPEKDPLVKAAPAGDKTGAPATPTATSGVTTPPAGTTAAPATGTTAAPATPAPIVANPTGGTPAPATPAPAAGSPKTPPGGGEDR